MAQKSIDHGSELVVLAPVRNEKWCLEGFVSCASEWADHIIISDQGDDNEPQRLARKYPKVEVIRNESEGFNERENRTRLLQHARAKHGLQWIFCVDADERLSSLVLEPGFRDSLRQYKPGTALSIPFVNLTPDLTFWEVKIDPIAFLDDGREPTNRAEIHFPRTSFNDFPEVVETDLKLIHLQYLDPKRVGSKIEWYKLHECLRLGAVNPVSLFRRYSHQAAVRKAEKKPLPLCYVKGYYSRGLDPISVEITDAYWWSSDLKHLKSEITPHQAGLLDLVECGRGCDNPAKAWLDHLVMRYLRITSRYYKPRKSNPLFLTIFVIDKLLGLLVSKLRE